MRTFGIYIFFSVAVLSSCKKEKVTTPPPVEEKCATYSEDIVAIVNSKCAISGCHVEGSSFGNFTVYGELKERADNGRIEKNVFELKIMPPPTAPQLIEEEKEKIKCWLDDGAPQN